MSTLDRDTVESLIMHIDTNIELSSVLLSDENKEKIELFLEETKHREELFKHNLEPMNRILMFGDSGCGKTYLTKALSNHLGFKMLYVDIAKAISQGNAAINISNIFTLANETHNCIIFLDECDGIAWNRDSSVSAEKGDIRRATNSLFQQMDQMDRTNIIVGATNMLKRLDPAFERRFNLKMKFRRPKGQIDSVIDEFLYDEFNLIRDCDKETKRIVQGRLKLSYDELKGVVHRQMKRAIISNTLDIHEKDIYSDIAKACNVKTYFGTDVSEYELDE